MVKNLLPFDLHGILAAGEHTPSFFGPLLDSRGSSALPKSIVVILYIVNLAMASWWVE